MKTIEARITKNIKEDPSIDECDIWNIEATFLDPFPMTPCASPRIPVKLGLTNLRQPEQTARALPLPYERSENHAYSLVR
jgi:hypothetical protein